MITVQKRNLRKGSRQIAEQTHISVQAKLLVKTFPVERNLLELSYRRQQNHIQLHLRFGVDAARDICPKPHKRLCQAHRNRWARNGDIGKENQ